ncbi:MAG: hypothetical protein WBC91_26975 [Phototrophicaceae bacterium]
MSRIKNSISKTADVVKTKANEQTGIDLATATTGTRDAIINSDRIKKATEKSSEVGQQAKTLFSSSLKAISSRIEDQRDNSHIEQKSSTKIDINFDEEEDE